VAAAAALRTRASVLAGLFFIVLPVRVDALGMWGKTPWNPPVQGGGNVL